MTHYHFIGIGGAGLSAIAHVLLEGGHQVSGSDLIDSALLQSVAAAGGRVVIGHRAEQVGDADVVIRSSAIPDSNVEVRQANERGIPVLKRADFLGELLAGKTCLAVAGSHGKTTTTGWLAWVLDRMGYDPGYIVGGAISNLDSNAHAGSGDYFVIEADEYDYMFLGLSPAVAVITNVEHDHPDMFPTEASFREAFHRFAGRIVPGGTLVYCIDDPGARALVDNLERDDISIVSYGLSDGADFRAENVRAAGDGVTYAATTSTGGETEVLIRLAGEHNVRNSLAVLAVIDVLGLPLDAALAAIAEYEGVGRRFEIVGQVGGVTVIDDYAHHPTEIRVTLAAARQRYAARQLVAVWQPHTYSRTLTLRDEYLTAFRDADQLIVTDVFAAREDRPEGFDMRDIVAGIPQKNVFFIPDFDDIHSMLRDHLRSGDVLLVMSAGDAVKISQAVVKSLKQQVEAGAQE